ncbi:MAG: tetratricopeptide repeat protein [Nocardiopsaceae bacterium]|nr:tetratricopeptide repeat protein [Nocardiopsaceae bacterium]
MEDDQTPVPWRFAEDLRQLRLRAGQPSYSALERLSGHRLKRATMSDVLNDNRVNIPDWRFVSEFVTACRAAAAENRLDANQLGTVSDWKRHWDGAVGGVIAAGFPGRGVVAADFPVHGGQSPSGAAQVVASQRAEPTPPAVTDPAERDRDDATARPSLWGPVPSRLPDFVGRNAWLEALRQALTRDDPAGVVAIQGLSGVGKTQVALEYAYRFSGDYDLVWWVPCDDPDSAQAAMTGLANALGLADVPPRSGEGMGESEGEGKGDYDYTELLDVLRRGEPYGRWLLIFDNADEPDEITNLIPPVSATGHVLITTRSSHWEASGDLVELDVFDRTESVEFLSRRMRGFGTDAAHRLAEGVGDLPLLLEHAVESHVAVGAYLARLDSDPLGLLDDQPADYQATIADVWRATLDKLAADAPDALDLLRCLAFFGGEPVPRESLERGGYLTEVSIHSMLREPLRRVRAIRRLRRAGLLQVRADTGSLAVHRVTRCVVRDMVARSGEADAERARHDVHLLLAAADPRAPDDPATWRSYDDLREHAEQAGAAACSQEIVRKFVVNLVRFLNAAGNPHAALDLADGALAQWDADAHWGADDDGAETSDGHEHASDDRMAPDSHIAMRVAKADALFALGMRSQAFRLRQEALTVMRPDPGRWAAEITGLEGTSGEWCRVTGDFAGALSADRDSVRAHVAEFGDDDPRTFGALNSLIADLVIGGAGTDAIATADGLYRDCLAFYGDADHPAALAARNVLGRCQWLSGEYAEAVATLAEVHREYDGLKGDGALDGNHPWRLVHDLDYAIARRDDGPWHDDGLMPADLHVLADDVRNVRRRCWRALGPDHPQTIAATVVLASVLRRIGGRAGEAARLLEEAERRYESALPGHPYAHACGAFLATVRQQAANDDPQQVAARSVPVIQDMVGRLADSVGDAHPLSLTTLSALANTLARAGELGTAVERGADALAGFQELLGPGHPHTRIVEANAETIRSGLTLAPAQFLQNRLADIDFTPLPL